MNSYQLTNITRFIEILAVITFIVLLGSSLYMLYQFHLCDNNSCKAFTDAEQKGVTGSKEYTIDVLDNLAADGIWGPAFIGAAIAVPLSLWFIGIPITILTFAIMFFVVFITIYCILGFLIHHYINPIKEYAIDYIRNSC